MVGIHNKHAGDHDIERIVSISSLSNQKLAWVQAISVGVATRGLQIYGP